jgi:hypothetical protein
MSLVGIWIIVSRLGWLRIAAEYHGLSSQMGSTRITRKGVVVSVDEARAWKLPSACLLGRIPDLICTILSDGS